MKLKIVTVCENKINKENSELKRAIIKASEELGAKIFQFYESGVCFNNIYNAENIKYDKHGDCFFTYKAHGMNKTQLRLLYSCVQTDDTTYKIVIDYIEKRKTVNKGHKDHIEKFSKYDSMDLNAFCQQNNICLAV